MGFMRKYGLLMRLPIQGWVSCGNKQEYGYDEKMICLFYDDRERLDGCC